jgi:branched-subunit amino acid transport protein AzlD
MGYGGQGGGQIWGIVISMAVVLGLMMLRNRRPRRLRLEAMWIRPLIFIVLVGLTLVSAPLSTEPLAIGVMVVALIVGVGFGWLRGSLMRIDVHPETHDISAQASPVGMVFILAVLILRMALRNMAASIAGLPASVIADSLILLAGGMMITQSVEMWLRARRLLADAQAAKSGGVASRGDTPIVS